MPFNCIYTREIYTKFLVFLGNFMYNFILFLLLLLERIRSHLNVICALQINYYYYYCYWIIVNRVRIFTHLALWSSLFSLSNLTAASQISSLFGLAWNARDRICRAWFISPYNEQSNWDDGKEHFKDETRKKTSTLRVLINKIQEK